MIRALPIYTEREPFQVLGRKSLDMQWFTWLPQPKKSLSYQAYYSNFQLPIPAAGLP